jgi:hypothetical protein
VAVGSLGGGKGWGRGGSTGNGGTARKDDHEVGLSVGRLINWSVANEGEKNSDRKGWYPGGERFRRAREKVRDGEEGEEGEEERKEWGGGSEGEEGGDAAYLPETTIMRQSAGSLCEATTAPARKKTDRMCSSSCRPDRARELLCRG